MKILILKPSSLGDIVHALPAVNLIRHARPDAHIAWLINDSFADILKDSPMVNEVIAFPRADFGRVANLPKFFAFCRQLREKKFDLVLDLQGLLRSGWMAWATRAPSRIGLSDAREGARLFYTSVVAMPRTPTHAVERYLLSLSALGIARDRCQFPLPSSSADAEWAEKFVGTGSASLIVINPCARWEAKRWPPQNFAALIEQVLAKSSRAKFVLIGSVADQSIANAVLAVSPPHRFVDSSVINAVGQTSLPQLVALLRRCDLLVTNDSGPMHIAAALGKPLVALFGPTDPAQVGPYSAHLLRAPFTVLKKGDSVEQISVEEVLAAVAARLSSFHD